MEKLSNFVADLRNNRYSDFESKAPDVKKEFLHVMSLLGNNVGTSPYSNLSKVIDLAENCHLQQLVKFKVDAITEYQQLVEDFKKTSHNASPRKVSSHGQQQGRQHQETRQETSSKNHSPNKSPVKGNHSQSASRSPVKQFTSTVNGQSHGQTKGSQGEPRDLSQSPTKKPQGGKTTPSVDVIRRQEEEIEHLRNRLSKFAGERLHDGNPSIADLSDPMRPNKIAEYFSELYDNEFTEAFNELSGAGMGEEKAIKRLNKILRSADEYTYNTSDVQLNSLMLCFVHPRGDKIQISEKTLEDLKRHTKNIQRESAGYAVTSLCQSFIADQTELNSEVLKIYAWRCVQLTWHMNVQTPKLYLHWSDEGSIMGDHVKAYTKSGTVIGYQVWPTLFLHIDGPVLLKGIVQPK